MPSGSFKLGLAIEQAITMQRSRSAESSKESNQHTHTNVSHRHATSFWSGAILFAGREPIAHPGGLLRRCKILFGGREPISHPGTLTETT